MLASVARLVFLSVCVNTHSFLLAAVAVAISRDGHFPPWALGACVAVFGSGSFIGSLIGPRLRARFTLTACLNGIVIVSGAANALVGLTEGYVGWVLPLSLLCGIAAGSFHPVSNELIGQIVQPRHQSLVFSCKQAGVPFATSLAMFSSSLDALVPSWEWLFFSFGAVTLLCLRRSYGPRHPAGGAAEDRARYSSPSGRWSRYFYRTAFMTCLAAAGCTVVASFAVVGGVQLGLESAEVAQVVAIATLLCALARVAAGYWLHDGSRWSMFVVVPFFALGAVGTAVLILAPSQWYLSGILLVLSLGWAWPGVMHYMVHAKSGGRTALASSIVQSGTFTGTTLGPLLAGMILTLASLDMVWLLVLGCLIGACLLGVSLRLKSTGQAS